MYGIYDEEIMELRRILVKVDERYRELFMLKASLEVSYGPLLSMPIYVVDRSISGEVLAIKTRYEDIKRAIDINRRARVYYENEIDRLKAAWRDSRPRDGYFPMDDIDLMSKIREDGFINGRII